MQTHLSRRHFLKTSLLASAGVTLGAAQKFDFSPAPQHIGVQLWSVREDMKKDPAGVLAAVAKMGYREVEPFGFDGKTLFGVANKDFSKLLKDNGLSMPSTHSNLSLKNYNETTKDITDDTKKTVDAAVSMGLKYFINPYMADTERPELAKLVKMYNAVGKYCKKAGIRFAYHNHNFEFEQRGPDDRLIMEWLLQEVDPTLMAMEMDIYWVEFAKFNPLDWFRMYPGRWELCHAKDVANTEKRESIEVGDGVVDFKTIFDHSKEAGLQYYIVELENYVSTPMQGIEKARKGLVNVWG